MTTIVEDGGVDLNWTAVDDERLDHYSIVVTAVSPISYSYGVPFYPGVARTNERIYPARELNDNLESERRAERVAPGQTWHVCVTGMMATPTGADVAPYTPAETQSGSDDFTFALTPSLGRTSEIDHFITVTGIPERAPARSGRAAAREPDFPCAERTCTSFRRSPGARAARKRQQHVRLEAAALGPRDVMK